MTKTLNVDGKPKSTTISSHEFTRMGWSYSDKVRTYIEEKMMPKLEEIYAALKKHPKYDSKLDRMTNIGGMFYSGDADYYAGIIESNVFTHNKRAIYIHMDNIKFVLQFIDKPYVDSFKSTIIKGIRIVEVFEPLDIDCIENSWGIKTTEQWATKLDLTARTFTDETKYSQKIGKGHIHVSRPTLERYIKDHNNKEAFDYDPIVSTCSMHEGNCEIHKVTATMFSLFAIGDGLGIEGVEI